MSVSSNDAFGALYADEATLEIACGGYGTVGIQLGGTWTGTFTFEGTVDHGVWTALNVSLTNSSTQVTTATTNGLWRGSCAGLLAVRARFSTYGSGTAQVRLLIAGVGGGSSGGGGGAGSDVNLIEVGGASIALGQAVMAASLPVVIASNQTAIPVSGTFSSSAEGPTGDPVPADAAFVGFSNADGDLTGFASTNLDYNSTTPPVVPQSIMGIALPGAGGPVAGGTVANPVRVSGPGTAGTANAGVMTVQGIASMTPVQVSQATAASLNATVVGTGTFVTQVSTVNGQSADDAAIAGLPIRIGGASKSPDGTDPGSVSAENETANVITDLNRRVYVNTDHPRSLTVHLDGSSAYTDQALIADPGDGFQAVITNIIASTGAATALNFFLEEGSTKIFGPIYLEAVAGRGFCSGPIYLPCTASTAVTLTSSAAIAQSFQVNYFIQAV